MQTVEKKLAALLPASNQESYLHCLKLYTAFQGPLETFFKDVIVNAPDPAVRNNRLALLTKVQQCLARTGADITRL